jgi:hypothetical protein
MKTMTRKQTAASNRRTIKVGDLAEINFAGGYWANGMTGQVSEILDGGRLVAVRVSASHYRCGYATIDCPPSQIKHIIR